MSRLRSRLRLGSRGCTRWGLVVVMLAAALVLPAAAFAFWSQTYVSNTTFHPDGIGLSAFNQSLYFNQMTWTNNGDTGEITLCDSSYTCYPYKWDNGGTVADTRTISYGRAKCHSWSGNAYDMYVQSCYTEAG